MQNDSQDLESRLILMSERISSIVEKVESKESIINDTFSALSEIHNTVWIGSMFLSIFIVPYNLL